MGILRKLFYVSVFSNAVIATAAVAQAALTYLLLDLHFNMFILLIEGTSTLLLYNCSLLLSKPTDPQKSPFHRTRWFFKHEKLMWVSSGIALLLLIYALTQLHVWTIGFLGIIGIISLLYNIPIIKNQNRRVGLRQIPGLKIFHIAFLWSLSTVGLPVIEGYYGGEPINWITANYLGCIKIVFIIICTLPFDVRDMKQDSYYNLRTIPNIIGKERAIRLNYITLLLHSILIVFAPFELALSIGLIATNVLLLFILKIVIYTHTGRYNTAYLLDISLIVQFLFPLLSYYLIAI